MPSGDGLEQKMGAIDMRCNWCWFREQLPKLWPRLAADEVDSVSGSRRYLIEVICEKYGCAEREATEQVDRALDWLAQRAQVSATGGVSSPWPSGRGIHPESVRLGAGGETP
jgi:hypothetical protein